ncbi:MAG: AGE family epimerase/isomerase [Siphonobacter aquaeclarae]|nr:AGE family epimerase/isomerase [Siphonobacter aquaeclarae]
MLSLPAFRQEVRHEFDRILQYWQTYSPDRQDGFYGRVDARNQPDPSASRSMVLIARILWTFSLAYEVTRNPVHRKLADRAFAYLRSRFVDPKYGGVYWSVRADGSSEVTKKQLYAQGFALYGLSEYYRTTKQPEGLAEAQKLFRVMVDKAYDSKNGGFIEAFNQDWSDTDDYILSKGPLRKSMNTHLHLIEPITNLYRVWPDAEVKKHTKALLEEVFMGHIIDPETARMRLFFTEDWQARSPEISYGHDIEASWLLYETAEILDDKPLLQKTKDLSLRMATATLDGLNPDGALTYEYNPETGHKNEERSWWVLSEQMVGYFNAYQLSGKQYFLEKSLKSWEFIQKYLLDKERGEWYLRTDAAHHASIDADKITAWKCPYHNARACFEIERRIGRG